MNVMNMKQAIWTAVLFHVLALATIALAAKPIIEADVYATDASDGLLGLTEVNTGPLQTGTVGRVKGAVTIGDGGDGTYIWNGSNWEKFSPDNREILEWDENSTFDIDHHDDTGWTLETGMTVTATGNELVFESTSAPTAGIAKRSVTVPSEGDYVIYFEAGADSSTDSTATISFHDGANYIWDVAFNFSRDTATVIEDQLALRAYDGTHNDEDALIIDTTPERQRFCVWFDEHHDQVSLWVLQEGRWTFHAGADVSQTVMHSGSLNLQITTGGADTAKLYLKRCMVCRPNIIMIGASLIAGHSDGTATPRFDPDRDFYSGKDDATSTYLHWMGDLTEGRMLNSFIPIKGVGNEDSDAILTRLQAAMDNATGPPKMVIIGVSAKDGATPPGFTLAQHTTKTQALVTEAHDEGALVVLTNTTYHNADHGDFPTIGDFQRDWWVDTGGVYRKSLVNVSVVSDAPRDLRYNKAPGGGSNEYANPDFYHGDGSHLTALGYESAGSNIARDILLKYQIGTGAPTEFWVAPDPLQGSRVVMRDQAGTVVPVRGTRFRTAFIPIGDMNDGNTAPGAIETFSDGRKVDIRKFAGDATEDCEAHWSLPGDAVDAVDGEGWQVKVRVKFIITEATAPAATEGVNFEVRALGTESGDDIGASPFGAICEIDTGDLDPHIVNDIVYSPWGEMTIGNGAEAGESLFIKVARDHDDAADTYVQDVGVIGIEVKFAYESADY